MKYILGIGNPLMDILAPIDHKFLEKNGFKMNDAILAESKHMPLYDELKSTKGVKYIAGGSTLNSIRVCQWVLRKENPNCTRFIGCIGSDQNGVLLKNCAEKDGVKTFFMVDKTAMTGLCGVGILDKERTMFTALGAANNFNVSHLENPEITQKIEECAIFYCSGFFLTVSMDSILKIAEHSLANSKIFAVNISAHFIVTCFGDRLRKILFFADFVFMNEQEAQSYADEFLSDTEKKPTLEEIAKSIAKLPYAESQLKRTVVITRGPKSTIVNQGGEILLNVPVAEIPPNSIVDLNGAGDAFVGGFLAALSKEKQLLECIKMGHKAAGRIIQKSGVTIEDDF